MIPKGEENFLNRILGTVKMMIPILTTTENTHYWLRENTRLHRITGYQHRFDFNGSADFCYDLLGPFLLLFSYRNLLKPTRQCPNCERILIVHMVEKLDKYPLNSSST